MSFFSYHEWPAPFSLPAAFQPRGAPRNWRLHFLPPLPPPLLDVRAGNPDDPDAREEENRRQECRVGEGVDADPQEEIQRERRTVARGDLIVGEDESKRD